MYLNLRINSENQKNLVNSHFWESADIFPMMGTDSVNGKMVDQRNGAHSVIEKRKLCSQNREIENLKGLEIEFRQNLESELGACL